MSDAYIQALRNYLASISAVSSKVNGKIIVNQPLEGQDLQLKGSFKSLISCEFESISGNQFADDLVLKADIRCRYSKEHTTEIVEAVKAAVDDGVVYGAVHLYVSKIEGDLAWSKPASAWRCELLIHCTTNTPPTINSLTVYPASPQIPGKEIHIIANYTNAEEDDVVFRFLLTGPATGGVERELTGWIKDNHFIWKPTVFDTGANTIKVQVRDQKHAGPDSFDDEDMASFTVTNTTPSISSLSVYPASPQIPGKEIHIIANISYAGDDDLVFRFLITGPATDGVERDLTGWISSNHLVWKPTIFDTGSNMIKVQVRDQKHAGPESYDDEDTASFTVTDTTPSISSLSIYPASPQVAETEIKVLANVSYAGEDELLFKFWLTGPGTDSEKADMTGWTTNARWIWKPTILDTGSNTITVDVRDGKHAGSGSYDDQETASFTVTS